MSKPVLLLLFFFLTAVSFAEERRYVVPIEDSPVYGPQGAQVTIIEFLDYQ